VHSKKLFKDLQKRRKDEEEDVSSYRITRRYRTLIQKALALCGELTSEEAMGLSEDCMMMMMMMIVNQKCSPVRATLQCSILTSYSFVTKVTSTQQMTASLNQTPPLTLGIKFETNTLRKQRSSANQSIITIDGTSTSLRILTTVACPW
jgi:hypothetical protein